MVTGNQKSLDTLNPGDNTLKGIFGSGLSAAETPRAVTSLSAQAIEALNINDLHDIVKAAPNAYASSGFGTPSLPSIRGQLGELFQDGIRRQAGNNGFGLPLSFNSVEQIDVVKGPSPVLFGSTQRNGGFVNLQTKVAPTTESKGKVTLRAGRWDQYSAQVDYGPGTEEGKRGEEGGRGEGKSKGGEGKKEREGGREGEKGGRERERGREGGDKEKGKRGKGKEKKGRRGGGEGGGERGGKGGE